MGSGAFTWFVPLIRAALSMVLCPDPWLQNLGAAGSVPHSKPQSVRLIGGGRLLSSIRAVGDAKGRGPKPGGVLSIPRSI